MKVILQQDVKNLGKKGDLVNASDGYARNFLFPKDLQLKQIQAMNDFNNKEASKKFHKAEEIKKKRLKLMLQSSTAKPLNLRQKQVPTANFSALLLLRMFQSRLKTNLELILIREKLLCRM